MVNKKKPIKKIINEKMRLLYDFGVCDYNDFTMRNKLADEIKRRSSVDPQIVLDSYCKPLVKQAMDSWT